ncbi:MAG: molybdenum cofactor guanylyltransferase [Victivallales bacterium]|nr:molybdenum cofactor guanylyltransferase [Victivallales bacterium]MCF7889228.1 molybdenum cofactor guanylyltransferase [Victivallales bacterium]
MKTAIILAGGKNSRIGEDKALLEANGSSFIELIIRQLRGYFEEIIIGANNTGFYSNLSYCRVVPDFIPGQGPLMGIYSTLSASSNDVNFITACDVPNIDIRFIKKLLSFSENFDIVLPVIEDDKYEPLFAVYRKSCLSVIEKSLIECGNRKIDRVFSLLNVKYVKMLNNNWYYNINTEADYLDFIKKRNK